MSKTGTSYKEDGRIKIPTRNEEADEERPVYVTETFVPFDGTMDEFKHTSAFTRMVKQHSFVLIKLDATRCTGSSNNTSPVRNGSNNEKYCKKGMLVSTYDW